MVSAEPENMPELVLFDNSVVIEPEDKVENWLKKIEDTMVTSLRALAVVAYNAFPVGNIEGRKEWMFSDYPS